MKNKSVFDKILKKETYIKQEVKELLYGTYEGFTEGWLKAHSKSIQEAKKEVFDVMDIIINYKPDEYRLKRYEQEKKRHLSTFAEQKRHNNDFKKPHIKTCINSGHYIGDYRHGRDPADDNC